MVLDEACSGQLELMCHGWEEEGAGSMEAILTTKPAAFCKNAQGRDTRVSHSGLLMANMLSEHIRHCLLGWLDICGASAFRSNVSQC